MLILRNRAWMDVYGKWFAYRRKYFSVHTFFFKSMIQTIHDVFLIKKCNSCLFVLCLHNEKMPITVKRFSFSRLGFNKIVLLKLLPVNACLLSTYNSALNAQVTTTWSLANSHCTSVASSPTKWFLSHPTSSNWKLRSLGKRPCWATAKRERTSETARLDHLKFSQIQILCYDYLPCWFCCLFPENFLKFDDESTLWRRLDKSFPIFSWKSAFAPCDV